MKIEELQIQLGLVVVGGFFGLFINVCSNALYDLIINGFDGRKLFYFLFFFGLSILFADMFLFGLKLRKTDENIFRFSWEYLKSRIQRIIQGVL